MLHADLLGVPELRASLSRTSARLTTGLRGASLDAAVAGIEQARSDHPHEGGRVRGATRGLEGWHSSTRYTDRTGHLSGVGDGGSDENSHAEQADDGEAEMIWPVDYASFVDKRTSHARPYPFTPGAEHAAEQALLRQAKRAIKDASAAFNEGR